MTEKKKPNMFTGLIHDNRVIRDKYLRRWKSLNKYFTIPFYRIGLLPLLGMGRIFLLLTTIGRKSGKLRRTPLEYHRLEGIIHIFILRGENADVVKNMRANPDQVNVRHGFHWYQPRIEILNDLDEKFKITKWYAGKYPKAVGSILGLKINEETIDNVAMDFAKLISIVRLHKN